MNKYIKNNIKIHNKIWDKYEEMHGEIFNPIEQERLHRYLKRAIDLMKIMPEPKLALDYGCGSGNLTRHLIELGFYVVSADISENFLELIKQKFGQTKVAKGLKINGNDLSCIKNNYFDFTAAYSVLHHIPDYLQIIKEMVRVTKLGGIIYLDHERSESFWQKDKKYLDFLKLVKRKIFFNFGKNLKKYLLLSNYIHGIRRLLNPHYQSEGDIHVWPDDHIEWKKIENLFINSGCKILLQENYLLYNRKYPLDIYNNYKDKCNDCSVMVARKEY